jgi:hypothetical protein
MLFLSVCATVCVMCKACYLLARIGKTIFFLFSFCSLAADSAAGAGGKLKAGAGAVAGGSFPTRVQSRLLLKIARSS